MPNGQTNNIVAKELSEALARCKNNGVDEQSLRTGLLTITIANFVNRLGMANTVDLFTVLPEQITSGIFDRYIDPKTNTPRAVQAVQAAPGQQTGYYNTAMPQNFIPPQQNIPTPTGYTAPATTNPTHSAQAMVHTSGADPAPLPGKRRLPD